jgi:exo-1,4-beta-D-glucosaminidase
VYWVSPELDVLDWPNSDWCVTPVSKFADNTKLNGLAQAHVTVVVARVGDGEVAVTLENHSGVPAFFLSLNLVDGKGGDVLPTAWDDNYITLWPREKMTLKADKIIAGEWEPSQVQVVGRNVERRTFRVGRR